MELLPVAALALSLVAVAPVASADGGRGFSIPPTLHGSAVDALDVGGVTLLLRRGDQAENLSESGDSQHTTQIHVNGLAHDAPGIAQVIAC